MKQIEVASRDAKQRLDKYLKRIFPEMGTGFLYKMLRKKNITLNGKKADGSEQVQEGDLIQCFFSEETFHKFAGNALSDSGSCGDSYDEYKKAYDILKDITVIYEDEHILLLNKPAGVLSQKAKPEDISLNEWMIGYLLNNKTITGDSLKHFKPSVCNRLDRNTGGIVICGKTLLGSREISRMLKDRSLKKYYRTYVHGKMEGSRTLTAYHRKNAKKNQAEIIFLESETVGLETSVWDQSDSQPRVFEAEKRTADKIVTAYRTIETTEQYSYLEIELITGKTHQIRAHLSAYGHPLVGDLKYGSQTPLGRKETYPHFQLLHAYRVQFPALEGELSYLSHKEFICQEPKAFMEFRKQFF